MRLSDLKIILVSIIVIFCLNTAGTAQTQVNAVSGATNMQQQFDSQAATTEYLNSISPEQKEKSDSYFEGGYWISIWNLVLEIAIALVFLFGLSQWIMKTASKAKKPGIQKLIYVLLYIALAFLIAFPFTVYTSFFREHQYGLSNMNFSEWLSEELLGFVISVVAIGSLILVLYWIIKKMPERWWISGSGVVIMFLIIGMLISPVYISPLFNEYKPLEEGPVKEAILSLARANGVPADNVYQFDASKQSTRISANVSGMGSTIRISLNDNLLNKCSLEEIKAVMAHELGHYVLNHVYKLLIYIGLVIIIGFAVVSWLMKKTIGRFGNRLGITGVADIKSLPLLMLFFSVYMFLATPALNTIVRTTESEADIFGLNAAREPDGFASVAMKLSEYRKISPGKLEEILLFDHPSGKTRVLMSMKWKAENLY
ncbi:MAG: M48 family metallopeptidase [Bacteroidales bacterium]